MDAEPIEAEIIEPEKRKRRDDYYLQPEPPRRRRWPWFLLGGCVMLCCLCFILPLAVLSIGGVVFSAVIEGSEVTERGSEQLDVTADALTFVIDNEVGDITLETGDAGVIAVDYLKRAYGISRSQARSRLDDVTVRLEDAGEGAVRLTVDRPSGGFSLARVDSVDLNITVPANTVFDLDVNGGVGAVRIGGEVQASHVDAQVNVGEIGFSGVFTADLADSRFKTNVGEVRLVLPRDLYARVEAETNVGDITVDRALSTSDVENTDEVTGYIWRGTVGAGSGAPPLLELAANVGDIRIDAE
ncbi:MAG: hypothetical protein AAGU78_14300 [Chloroflexota bacterium]|jgi:hypothetical protein|nr:DUF4097 domain-containing protein [Anaerolineae bacterium]HMM29873.1 hypothetical protein [Aggregatilineaceae bacterium]